MKNILIVDSAENCVYDIYAATDDEFFAIFPKGTDIAFIDEIYARKSSDDVDLTFAQIWRRRIPKRDAVGIHGTIFYGMPEKKAYYPTRKDEEAINPDGSPLRPQSVPRSG